MKVEIVGGESCPNCAALEERTREALNALGAEAEVSKRTGIAEAARRGIMSLPGLVVDGEVVLSGRVPPRAELEQLLGERS